MEMSADTVQKDIVVSMEYTLHVENEEIDSSKGQDPLQFLVGYGNIISGLEREMMGMKVGESKDVVIQPAEAYGFNGDSIEAEAWAYMAVRSLNKLPLSFPMTTKVGKPMTGGVLALP